MQIIPPKTKNQHRYTLRHGKMGFALAQAAGAKNRQALRALSVVQVNDYETRANRLLLPDARYTPNPNEEMDVTQRAGIELSTFGG